MGVVLATLTLCYTTVCILFTVHFLHGTISEHFAFFAKRAHCFSTAANPPYTGFKGCFVTFNEGEKIWLHLPLLTFNIEIGLLNIPSNLYVVKLK